MLPYPNIGSRRTQMLPYPNIGSRRTQMLPYPKVTVKTKYCKKDKI